MREVILLSSQGKIHLSQGDKTQIRAFLKNVGSNFMLNSKRLEISPKNGWQARVAGEPMTSFPNWRRRWDLKLTVSVPPMEIFVVRVRTKKSAHRGFKSHTQA